MADPETKRLLEYTQYILENRTIGRLLPLLHPHYSLRQLAKIFTVLFNRRFTVEWLSQLKKRDGKEVKNND